ncbi:MAG: tRNA (N6-isopentenyl adenosine(37)-C2)-methylthiotransferase MiaB [Deltaproteobacteria bacterium]|jgi:tRNA-2-methylthio-N6-dimethylallyladenosine synthase|nr:tRNA (N6-isopentenyl adenosine(37)-C2)-methylthiotransferase MiaB [Deltaproteobacteria bacterium]MBW2531674.1 tRNA (N6-isopentenyl adenosine(37)-C2)-methylthiotransferase MiaB [Deltaproteobacteria bacterium]
MARVAITTFGCQMNRHDSDRMAERLVEAGHTVVAGLADAEVVLLNTCTVRDKAEQKLRSELGRLVRRKRQQPGLVLAVAGCVASARGKALCADFPGLDLVLGPDQIDELPALVASALEGAAPQVETTFDLDRPRFAAHRVQAPAAPTAYVTTTKGCDERCSFCVVPRTRGPERHRPSEEILSEIDELVHAGCSEVTLLGQTVNHYVDPTGALGVPGDNQFPLLLRAIASRVPRLARLRYEAPHPRHLTDELVRAHRDLPPLVRHLHLPVQSGSDRILKRMVRRHTRAGFLRRIAALRAAVPSLTLSTDVIVGFPGEEEDDFCQTLSLVEEVGFVGLYGFTYSPRPGTPALSLGDPVDEATKGERLQRVFALSERLVGEHLQGLVGTVQQVLIEGPSKQRPEYPSGRTDRNEIVHVVDAGDQPLVGRIVPVAIVEALGHSLLGRLACEDPAAAEGG